MWCVKRLILKNDFCLSEKEGLLIVDWIDELNGINEGKIVCDYEEFEKILDNCGILVFIGVEGVVNWLVGDFWLKKMLNIFKEMKRRMIEKRW